MTLIRTSWRFATVVVLFLFAGIELLFTRPRTRPDRAAWLSRFCGRMFRSLDIHVFTHGPVPMKGAVIANHTTVLDIISNSAVRPCVFVAKAEVRKLPLMGWMSFMAGTVYVTRGAGGSAQVAAESMAKGFRDGLPVVFFPEGTTGVEEGTTMPFRSGLIAESLEAEQPMHAAFTTYRLDPSDIASGKTVRSAILWGRESMQDRIWNLCKLHRVEVHIRFAEAPIAFSEAALANRKVAAVEARDAVNALSHAPEI